MHENYLRGKTPLDHVAPCGSTQEYMCKEVLNLKDEYHYVVCLVEIPPAY